MLEFEVCASADGSSPFREWMDGLDRRERAKVYATIRNVERYGIGTALRNEWVKKLDADIWEVRAQFGGNAQRAPFFFVCGNTCVIAHGFSKKTPKTPRRELRRAHRIMARYKEERDAYGTI
ncbi:type II toxin-antitoxin system RelE/ParE family toxin [Bifidobacterium scardovii]|uniref:Toxin RelE n=1 Tax=Bifidobacterium scardovii TaxID=158787 RepID=A0A087DIM7_9BIFI|nr:type II toxin-antitoxin system RelE/ParE family toxin [Bifidobacterium scardovii]KFI95377.1 toxin RelE [Bifidobacterium scardovii]MBS6947923.1 type II toxin-antitoxin system RelE/ParE family toxin [Bifidobacterium scardovii]MDK6348978.1 type II toxin-antitoxin system RelE/ParE family toxin [Bifidobacterium scardovii]MDU3735845.1 type II toxin-antitoxin system RelE/ParE family toxin [Bifidobacterium scardovii]MDU5296324.1 type II toxin-antitoxin system RelE/ParE family toxin [Bifidobacterium